MSTFTNPSSPGDGITWEDHRGALLIIHVHSLEAGIQTTFGPKDAVKADVHVVDGTGAGKTYDDCLIFPTLLVSQTKRSIGQKVLGRLGTGNAKPGQKPPWLLDQPTTEDTQLAEQWLTKNRPAVTSAAPPF
jgi:hypothetical protein